LAQKKAAEKKESAEWEWKEMNVGWNIRLAAMIIIFTSSQRAQQSFIEIAMHICRRQTLYVHLSLPHSTHSLGFGLATLK